MIVRHVAACTASVLALSLAACKEAPVLADPSTIDAHTLETSVIANATSLTLAAADDLNRVPPPMSEGAPRERDARPTETDDAEPTSSTTTTGADLPSGPAPVVGEPRSAAEAAEHGTVPTASPATPKPMMPTAPAETVSPSR